MLLLIVGWAGCGLNGSDAMVKTLYVGPYRQACTGVGPQECYLVRESPHAAWTLFYDDIEGFDFEEGYAYELKVAEEPAFNPPADASSIKVRLVAVIKKTKASAPTDSPADG